MSFDDINGGADNIMYMGKYDGNAPDFETYSAFKLWNFGFKAAPKDGVTIAHSRTTEHKFEWQAEAKAYKPYEKSATKLGMKHGDVKFDVSAAQDKWTFKAAKPLVSDDWNVDGSIAIEGKPTKSMKGEVAFGVDSPDMSGTKLNMNLSVEQESKAKDGKWNQQDPKIKFDMCANVEKDYNIGLSLEHDTKELSGPAVAASKSDDGNCYFVGYNHGDKFMNAGCLVANKECGFTHAYELRYFMNKEHAKRFYDMPINWVAAGKYQLNKASGFNYSVEFGANVHAQCKFEHKVDKNWKVAMAQSFDMAKKAEQPYNLGFDVSYTL